MAEQFADDREAEGRARADAGERVAKIMHPNVGESGALAHAAPNLIQRPGTLAGSAANENVFVALHARDALKIVTAGGLRYTAFSRVLLVVEQEQPALEIDVAPAQLLISPRRQPVNASTRIAAATNGLPLRAPPRSTSRRGAPIRPRKGTAAFFAWPASLCRGRDCPGGCQSTAN